jgi:Ti-type conjugative transfer relaxase TraA
VAIYRLDASIVKRSAGQSAVASAAYRSAEKLQDERLGITFEYKGKRDVTHSEILAPEDAPAWATDRQNLWNKVEESEKFNTAQVAREIQLTLPEELTHEQQIALTREFVRANYVDHGLVADISIHSKPGNPHAHVLLTMRTIDNQGFSKTKAREFNSKKALLEWRESWADCANYHLARAGHDIRIDHRSYAALGIDLEPQNKIGIGVHKGDRSALARYADHKRIAQENGERIIAKPQIALDFLSRQRAIFSEYDIYKLAHRQSVDIRQYREVLKAITESKDLVRMGQDKDGRERFTTIQTLEAEKNMLQKGMDLAGRRNAHPVENRYLRQARATRTLTPDQDRAFEHVMKSGDLCCVVGYAGSGKSYTLGAVREAYEAKGYRVIGTSLAGIAAEGLQRESGIESRTIARLMIDIENGWERLNRKDILIVDESGMVATRQMERLIEYAHQGGAKVVLVGSGQQLQPIEAGGPFRAFFERVGAAEMTGIRRQRTEWQQECTKQMEGTQAEKALETYRDKGRINEHDTTGAAINAIVKEWRNAQEQGSCVAVAFRNIDVEKLNRAIRAEAKEIDKLSGKEREFNTTKGKRIFTAGDRIVFLKNDPKIGVMNGNFGEVERIRRSKMQVRLDDGTRIAFDTKDYNHIDYGYAATTHKLQGATVDHTMVLADKYFDRHAALVALSRHRADVSMHWSRENFKDFDQLKATLTRERHKELAHDFRGEEIDVTDAKRDDLSRELDSRTGRTDHRDLGRDRGPDNTDVDRDKKRDRTSKHPGPPSIAGNQTEYRGNPAQREEPGSTDRRHHKNHERSAGKADVSGVSMVHRRGGDRRSRSAERIRNLAAGLFRESGSYAKARENLRQTAKGSSIILRRQLTELTKDRDKNELERFKKEINLAEYAQANGYSVDKRESSRNSKIMRHENGDKIVVATDKDGHGIYFSVRNDWDNGSIVDFVQSRRGMNLGETRRELRPWVGLGPQPERPIMAEPKPLPSRDFDSHQMTRAFAMTKAVEHHIYLESRGIEHATLQDSRFTGMVREDHRGNAVFPHYGQGGLTGYELKNDEFTGFSKGGTKGVWVSNNFTTAKEVVVTESAIDALSHAQIRNTGKETAYLSVGGEISKSQQRLISSLMERAQQQGAQITIATDNDGPGHTLAQKLERMAPKDALIKRDTPEQGKDFNESLQMQNRQENRHQEREQERHHDIDMGRGR